MNSMDFEQIIIEQLDWQYPNSDNQLEYVAEHGAAESTLPDLAYPERAAALGLDIRESFLEFLKNEHGEEFCKEWCFEAVKWGQPYVDIAHSAAEITAQHIVKDTGATR